LEVACEFWLSLILSFFDNADWKLFVRYQTVIGTTLTKNIANLETIQGRSNATNLKGIADSLISIFDDTFGIYASAKLMLLNETNPTSVLASLPAVTFGNSTYIYPITIVNALIVLAYVIEAVRTRGWNQLPKFNFMDTKDIIISSSAGGVLISKEASRVLQVNQKSKRRWYENQGDRLVGRMRVRRAHNSEYMDALVLDENGPASSVEKERRVEGHGALKKSPAPGTPQHSISNDHLAKEDDGQPMPDVKEAIAVQTVVETGKTKT
jgi:hypothetical protein